MASHPPRDKYVTMIIDLTAVRAGAGPAELLDVVEGRSKQISKPGSPDAAGVPGPGSKSW